MHFLRDFCTHFLCGNLSSLHKKCKMLHEKCWSFLHILAMENVEHLLYLFFHKSLDIVSRGYFHQNKKTDPNRQEFRDLSLMIIHTIEKRLKKTKQKNSQIMIVLTCSCPLLTKIKAIIWINYVCTPLLFLFM